jgi:hypothetical protein
MPAQVTHVNLQYSHTIGRGEQFGPGFTQPIFVARGSEGLVYVLCRASEYRPEGTRITVCTVDEEYVTAFARGVPQQGPHEYNFDDGSLVWPTSIAIAQDENVYVSDEWLNRISIFNRDGDYLGKWEERAGDGDGELTRTSPRGPGPEPSAGRPGSRSRTRPTARPPGARSRAVRRAATGG